MIAEWGHLFLIAGVVLAVFQAVVPMVGSYTGQSAWMRMGSSLAVGQFVLLLLSFLALVTVFIQDDFSVLYAANNSNTKLPLQYKISAVWGAHEGSLLLWALCLALWTMLVGLLSKTLPLVLKARTLAVLGMVAVGFGLFLLMTSNPFERVLPFPPADGRDLNPLLQDFGLIVHPPLLYMGYVGFAVPFAFAIAGLLGAQFDSAWARWVRPWTNIAWMFLTLGIALGSWWAYYELGWGGWWFWDPVENASFMPWLVGTALVHSLSVSEKRGLFRSWTLLLAIFAFSLSLLGTFLVRSGVLTSVHAFANDPERGLFVLIFLGLVVGSSLLLFAERGQLVKSSGEYAGWSRESLLLINNLLLVAATLMILIGTLYPLVADVLGLGKISVGPPYFNLFFVPLMSLLALFVAFGPQSRWKRSDSEATVRRGRMPLAIAILSAAALPWLYSSDYHWGAAVAVLLAAWVAAMTLEDLLLKVRLQQRRGVAWSAALSKLSGSYWGMVTAHLGIAVMVLGIGFTTSYDEQRDVRLAPGESSTLMGYEFTLRTIEQVPGPNYNAWRGTIDITRAGRAVATLQPEKRTYLAGGQTMTEADIDAGLGRDLYVSLGEPLSGNAWAVRLHVKPLIRCIWLGALMMALGGVLAAIDKRYRRQKPIVATERTAEVTV